MAVHKYLYEERMRLTPGNTPIRRRKNTQSQTQVMQKFVSHNLYVYSQNLEVE